MDFSKRSAKEVTDHHFKMSGKAEVNIIDNVVDAKDLDAMIKNFAEDCVFITLEGIYRGHREIREWFRNFMPKMKDGEGKIYGPVFEQNVAFYKWDMENKTHTIKRNLYNQGWSIQNCSYGYSCCAKR